ncbi:chorismate-binding protein [Blattabacterium cuenoti]|uniref:chorismate-binding protein n=1 Tax=Blattabacterium cuenoti TaxID=1653831 RepID=UPI00163BE3BA|nr:chorismate-binding protein [Blattabacterium cuenoti]
MVKKEISIFLLYRKIVNNYIKNNNFAIFRKPNEDKIFFYSDNRKISNNYFIIKDFLQKRTIKIYTNNIFYVKINSKKNLNNGIYSFFSTKDFTKKNFSLFYKKLIEKSISYIKGNFFKKVVVSKNLIISLGKIDLIKTFKNLIFSHINNLVSLWYNNNNNEFWIGSTPELLMKYKNKKLKTMALAGTIWKNDNKLINKWTYKEINEHEIVIQHINDSLKKYNVNFLIYKTKTISIDDLFHLKTNILIEFKEKIKYNEILKNLYPTPSICGLPIKKSMDFIVKNENYERSFYTGYIGIVNDDYNVELYLNLRCSKILYKKKKIVLYAGSGIIESSNIYREYIETDKKIKNILSNFIIKNI